jgi:CIC family chloride channel protein
MLIVEMTGNYSQMLPLLVSCFCAYAVAEFLKDLPIYEALLERVLKGEGDTPVFSEPGVFEFIVQPGARFSGRLVSTLGLPPGCILVRCSDGKREWVPKANTHLESHMHITAVISPDAGNSLEILRNGCKARTIKRKG